MSNNKLLLAAAFLVSSNVYAGDSLNIAGNFIYKGSSEQLVLSFPSDGVVQFHRYDGRYRNGGVVYKDKPISSLWMPYLIKGKGSAKALVCQYGVITESGV